MTIKEDLDKPEIYQLGYRQGYKAAKKKARDEIESYENPYPKDVFKWDNKEELEFNRGRFNRHCFEIVELMKEKLKEKLNGRG